MKNFKAPEIFIVILTALLILLSEYYFLVQENTDRAIFIGLWPPTMLALLIYLNQKASN